MFKNDLTFSLEADSDRVRVCF